MTDARIPERWLNDRRLLRLSDGAFRLHLTALIWAVSNRTDGVVDTEDLSLIPQVDAGRVFELEKAGLWRKDRNQWSIEDFAGTQTSARELHVLENVRRREREKKARQRAAKRDSPRDSPPGRSPGTVPRDSIGQDRPGQDRKGQAPKSERYGPEGDWPEVHRLGGED